MKMPNCITCGGEISTNQWNNYEGICSACIRNENLQESNIHEIFSLKRFKKKIKARREKWSLIPASSSDKAQTTDTLPNCISCGDQISKDQWNNFQGLCSECVRTEHLYQSNIRDIFASKGFKKKVKARQKKWNPIL